MNAPDARTLVPVDLGPGVRAVFTTVATGNVGSNVGDDPERVRAVRERLDDWVGAPVAFGHQMHGAAVHVVGDVPVASRAGVGGAHDTVAEADGLVTRRRDVALGVVVADCVPVLLVDVRAGVVGTAHAGRRGVVSGVVGEVVAAMVRLGADVGSVRAVVGPAACGACYEVPAPMRDEVCAAVPAARSTTTWGTPALDLPAAVRAELTALGVGQVEALGGCTIEDPRWFSHRAATGGRVPAGAGAARPVGRIAGVVRLV